MILPIKYSYLIDIRKEFRLVGKIIFEGIMNDPTLRLLELDQRHNELLDRLNELNEQISFVLDDWIKSKEEMGGAVAVSENQAATVA